MVDAEKMKKFIEYSMDKVYFYIESNLWSKLDNDGLKKWMNNFKSVEEKYCALKLLDRFVYYSEEDIVTLIHYGFYEKILREHVFKLEIQNNFQSSNTEILKVKEQFIQDTFILSLATGNPSESSSAMLRYLTIDIGFPEDRILDYNNLSIEKLNESKNLIIIDDFIGSSSQLYTFWNDTKIKLGKEEIRIKEIRNLLPDLNIEFFCLVCTEDGYINFALDNTDVPLKITYCEMLTEKYKVFGNKSTYFNPEEIEFCKKTLQDLCDRNSINLLGYKDYDYAIAFHHSIPDSSLPLFYLQKENWNHLFKNKKTYSNV